MVNFGCPPATPQKDLKDSGLFGTIVCHVGDSNFHVMFPFLESNQEHVGRVKAFSDHLVLQALEAEGTCMGEHGVGNGKMSYLQKEHGDSLDVMLSIKKALDPLNIMIPG